MKLVSDMPFGINKDFVCMGIVADSGKDYACLMQSNGNQYVEEIHWTHGKNFHTSTLHVIDLDKEWAFIYNFVSSLTTIFSPIKVKNILKQKEFYFYSDDYKKTKDYETRKKKGIL